MYFARYGYERRVRIPKAVRDWYIAFKKKKDLLYLFIGLYSLRYIVFAIFLNRWLLTKHVMEEIARKFVMEDYDNADKHVIVAVSSWWVKTYGGKFINSQL